MCCPCVGRGRISIPDTRCPPFSSRLCISRGLCPALETPFPTQLDPGPAPGFVLRRRERVDEFRRGDGPLGPARQSCLAALWDLPWCGRVLPGKTYVMLCRLVKPLHLAPPMSACMPSYRLCPPPAAAAAGSGSPQGRAAVGWRVSVYRQRDEDPVGGTVAIQEGGSIKVGLRIPHRMNCTAFYLHHVLSVSARPACSLITRGRTSCCPGPV